MTTKLNAVQSLAFLESLVAQVRNDMARGEFDNAYGEIKDAIESAWHLLDEVNSLRIAKAWG